MNKPTKILVHHTAVSRKQAPVQFWAVNKYHRDAKGPGGNFLFHYGKPSSMGYFGAYHIFIEANGREFRYRADHEEGAHAKGHNLDSLAVCLAGNFDQEMPTEAQIKTLKARLLKWGEKYNIPKDDSYPHRKFANYKSCYGSLLSDDWVGDILEPVVNDPEQDLKRDEILKNYRGLLDRLRVLLLQLQIALKGRRK